jgi:hypothetical protein
MHIRFWGIRSSLARAEPTTLREAQDTSAEYPQKVGWGHSTVEYAAPQTRRDSLRGRQRHHACEALVCAVR